MDKLLERHHVFDPRSQFNLGAQTRIGRFDVKCAVSVNMELEFPTSPLTPTQEDIWSQVVSRHVGSQYEGTRKMREIYVQEPLDARMLSFYEYMYGTTSRISTSGVRK